jgi:hypothetical protein
MCFWDGVVDGLQKVSGKVKKIDLSSTDTVEPSSEKAKLISTMYLICLT